MYYLVLILATAALAGGATVDRFQKLPETENNIQDNAEPEILNFIRLTQKPEPRIAHEPGTTLELTCKATASPAPSVRWYKNDAPVYEYDKESNEIKDDNPWTVTVASMTSTLLVSRTDAPTQYTCLVLSGANTARASTVVYSTDGSTDNSERSRLVPLSPRVLVSYKTLVETSGSTAVLPCAARGHPKPRITWTDHAGRDVTHMPRMKVLRSGELVISPLLWSDMGVYTCRATNHFGTSKIETFVYPAKASNI